MPRIQIHCDLTLSPEAFTRCRVGQRYWWLRGPGGFVDLDAAEAQPRSWREAVAIRWRRFCDPAGPWRGDRPISIAVDLPPGEYVLGAGGREAPIRVQFSVGECGAGDASLDRAVAG